MSKFSLKALAVACGLLGAGHAFALLPTDTPDVTIYVSGASAQGPGLTSALTGIQAGQTVRPASSFGLCQEGTDTVYTSGGNDRAVFCTFKTGGTIPASLAGKKVLVVKRDGGGSAYGIYPVSGLSVPTAFQAAGEAGPAISMLQFNSGCTQTTAPTTTTTGAGTCPTTNRASVQPDAGLADVEPKLFDTSFTLPAGVTLTTGVGLQGFGVAISQDGYQALQAAQGLNTADSTPGPNQPNLPSSVAVAILADQALGVYQTDWSAFIPAAIGKTVTVCRRSLGSGTQQSSNAFFLNTQCAGGPLSSKFNPAPQQNTTGRGTGFAVFELNGTGDVKTCLNEAGGTGKLANGTTLTFAANANDYQIGVMSLENTPGASDTWRFVKIDGVSPNYFGGAVDNTQIKSLVDGSYQFAYESTALGRTQNGKDLIGQVVSIFQGNSVGILTGIATVPSIKFYDGVSVARGTRFGNSCRQQQAQ